MAIDVTTPEAPGWWLLRLARRLQDERPAIDRLQAYFDGDHPEPHGPDKLRRVFRRFQRLARTNYLSLVVEAPLERMRVVGFRTGAQGDAAGDSETWRLWQSAHMDADSVLVHRTMLALRRAYVIVGPHPRKSDQVLITPEHPSQVTLESSVSDRRDVRAALKLFEDDFRGVVRAYLYLPDRTVIYESPSSTASSLANGTLEFTADTVGEFKVVDVQGNPYGEVPVVEFANRPTLLGNARSEFEDVIDIQDRINTTLFHRLVAEQFGSFRQKAILNYEFGEDEDGNIVAPDLQSDPGAAWFLEGENLRLFEFSQTDTRNLIEGVTTDIRDLAAITRTPPHYLLGGIVNSSGDALKAAETGLTAKVRERTAQAGEGWEQVMHLAHLVTGDTDRAAIPDMETIWADPESRTLGELADAAQKKKAIGVPWRQLMEDLGYSPQQIDRMETERASDALLQSFTVPMPQDGQDAAQPATDGPKDWGLAA